MSKQALSLNGDECVFPYPGGKARLADWVIEHTASHKLYSEPFGGAASVLFSKPVSNVEVYNDVDDNIVQFFRVLRNRPAELKAWLERVPFARSLLDEWATAFYDGDHPDDEIERAGRFFALRYLQFGAKADQKSGFAAFGNGDYNQARIFRNAVDALDKFAHRLSEVTIENADWQYIVDRYDSADSLFYLDPPYQDKQQYYCSSGIDHRQILQRMGDIDGDAIISCGRIPDWLDELSTDWHITTRQHQYSLNARSGELNSVTEALLTTYDPDNVRLFSGTQQTALCDLEGSR
jgi:DNA adenine methylase